MAKIYDEECALILEKMVFDKISFVRKGFSSNSEPTFSLQINTGKNENNNIYQVTVILFVEKEKEYDIEISLTGYFNINIKTGIDEEMFFDLINQNAVAILVPYIRSQLSLITAQPEMECLVMPPINVEAILNRSKKLED